MDLPKKAAASACSNSVCPGTVSYTHLDVYKRQVVDPTPQTESRAEQRGGTNKSLLIAASEVNVKNSSRFLGAMLAIPGITDAAVVPRSGDDDLD